MVRNLALSYLYRDFREKPGQILENSFRRAN